jgi:hypothetical protein
MIDLRGLDFSGKEVKTISIRGAEEIEDLTGRGK